MANWNYMNMMTPQENSKTSSTHVVSKTLRSNKNMKKLITDPISIPIPVVAVCTVCWQFQTNLQHGQEIDFQASPTDPEWCFVQAALRIIARFKLFCSRPNTHVALYLCNPGSTTCDWLTKQDVDQKL